MPVPRKGPLSAANNDHAAARREQGGKRMRINLERGVMIKQAELKSIVDLDRSFGRYYT
jgi:hypothetical protein